MITLGAGMLAFLTGVASHLCYFHRYEFHRYVHILLALCVIIPFAIQIGLTFALGSRALAAIWTTTQLFVLFILGGTSSTFLYRLFFNPLNKFPGPFAARLTNFWVLFKVGKKLNAYKVLEELHKKHGPYVRIGSNRLSIADPAVAEIAYSARSPTVKGEFYDLQWPEGSMHQERNQIEHDRRRRHWAPAFSDKVLRDYEPRVHHFNQKFIERIAEHKGGPMDVSKWFNLYSFDVMGALAFGRNYHMLDSGEMHEALGILTEGLAVMGVMLPMWFLRLCLIIPGASRSYHKFRNFCGQNLREAIDTGFHSNGMPGSTISSWLMKGYEHLPDPAASAGFVGDAQLLIVAGSDTTAATLTYLFFELARNAADAMKIREELKHCAIGEWMDRDIRHCEHLNGAINETLRLWPPGPSGLYRETPPEGLHVDAVFIPGQTIFNIPQYIIGRDESVYVDACKFLPERWHAKPELIKNRNAFNPFVSGSASSCIGKQLALTEIRSLAAHILLRYQVALAPHEDGMRLLNDSQDHFTMSLAPLDLVFTAI